MLLILLSLPAVALAEPDAIDELVRRALESEPALAAAAARARESRAAASLPGAAMDPMVSLSAMGSGPDMLAVDVMASQTLMPPGSLRAGRDSGAAGVDVAEARSLGAALALEAQVRGSSAKLAGALVRAEALERARTRAEAMKSSAQARVTAGLAFSGEIAMAEMDLADIDARLEAARGDAAMARATLERLTGESPVTLPLDALPPGIPDTGAVPMLTAMEAMRRMAAAEAEMARAERLPSLTVSAGWSFRTESMWGDMATAGVSTGLPIFAGRKQGARLSVALQGVDAAEADVEAARREVERTRIEMSAELEALRGRLAAVRRMGVAARTAAESARAAYVAGTGGLDPWLLAQRRAEEAAEMEAMLHAEALATYAELAAMLGTSLLEGT